MAENLPVSQLQDKDGTTYDIAAKRMSGTRTITVTGDVVGSVTTNLSGAVSLDVGIADNAVDTSCIADGAVTTSCLADNNVTLQKLSSELRESVGEAHTHTNKSLLDNYAAAGSASIPTYIANDGTPTACTDDFVHDAELTAEATARANADTQLQTNIDAEATTRGNADTALGNRITVLEAKTALSDFEDDITQQTYDATSEDPISGKGVAEALTYGGASWKEVGHGGSLKEYRVADINFGSYSNYVGKTWKFDWTVASNNNDIAFSPDGTLNIQITSRGTGYVPLVALSLTRTPGTKMSLNLPTFKLYQLADTSAHTIRYILSATAGNSAYMGAFYKLTAAYNQQGKESDITLYEKTELVLPEGYEACDTTRNVSYQTAYTNNATAVGSSTAPVYVDANGKVTACGSSLAVSVTGNAATATKATQDASGNVITSTYATKSEVTSKDYITKRLLTSSDDIAGTSGQFTNFYFNSSSVPTRLPSDFPASTGGFGEHIWGQDSNQERVILYASNVRDYHWEISTYGTTLVYKKVYTTPDSSYSNTSGNALSAAAVAKRRGLNINVSWDNLSNTVWIPVAQVVTTNTVASYTGNFNLSSMVTLTNTGRQISGFFDLNVRFNQGTPWVNVHNWTFAGAGIQAESNRTFLVASKNADNITWTITVYLRTNVSYSGARFWNFACTTYSGVDAGTVTECTHTAVSTEPTGDYTSLASQRIVACNINSDFGAASAVGSSTKPVYMDRYGGITECGSSLAVGITGNAATATKATQDASGNVITSTYATKSEVTSKSWLAGSFLTSSNDLDDCFTTTTNAGSIKVYGWASGDHPTHVPSTFANASCQMVVRKTHTGNYYIQEVIPTSGVSLARRVYNNGTWGDWKLQYFYTTSTYDATGTQQVNGVAVASALSSYMPLSRLKPSTDMAGFDSDDTNAYTGKAIGQKITDAISGNVGGWLGNKTVDEVNELSASDMKTGDYVTLTDGGTVTLGNVTVTAGDEIYWVSSTSVWQKKDNTVYVKHTDIASSSGTGVVRASSDDGKVEVNSSGVMSVNGWSTVKNDVSTAQTNISTLQTTTAQHTSDIASVNSAITAMSVDKEGGDGKYIRSISQSNGKISVEAVSLDTDISDSSLGDNAPSSAAVKTYVDAQVEAEAAARESAIELAVGNESSARESAIAAETSARESAIAAEVTARDSAISSAIATEVTNRNQAIADGVWDAQYNSETETLKFLSLSFTTAS